MTDQSNQVSSQNQNSRLGARIPARELTGELGNVRARVSVIILMHNGGAYIHRCLDSVLDQDFSDADYEVIVADSASSDGSREYVRRDFASVRLLELGQNHGFARGNNLAARAATGSFLVFLNQDTVVGRSWLRQLVEPLVAGELDAVHSNMLHPRDDEFAGIHTRGVPRKTYRYELTRFGHVEPVVEPRSDTTPRCRFLSGASFAIRRSVLEELGYLFDESLQTYCEDTELSLRLESRGYRVGFAPHSVVYHLGSFTTAPSRRNVWKHLILSRNRFLAFYRNSPASAFLRLLPLLLLSHPVKVYNRARLVGRSVPAVAVYTALGTAASIGGFLWFVAHEIRSGFSLLERRYPPWRRRGALQGARILLYTKQGHEAEVKELLDRQAELGVTLIRSNPGEILCLEDDCREKGISHVAVSGEDGLPAKVVDVTLGGGTEVMTVEDLYEWLTGKLPRATCAQEPAGVLSGRRLGDRLQRVFSFVAASFGLLLTVPFYPIIAAAIWLEDPGNVFFRQERLGRNGGRFTLIKFRTMRPSPRDGRAGAWMKVGLPDAELDRVTRVGAFMRRHRIDELPQLWNVLTGDLNAVGPRAETPRAFEERAKDIEGYGSRLVVVPGMAGWGLLNQYDDMYAKLQYDMYYIKHRSFRFDLYIFMATALRITLGALK